MAESNEKVNDLWRKSSRLLRKLRRAHPRHLENANALAGQARAVERKTVEVAEHGDGSILSAKILPRQ